MEDKLITIATHTYSRAELLKGWLESEGIQCFLKNVNLIQGSAPGGVKVRIHHKDVEKALRLIMLIEQDYKEDDLISEEKIKKVGKILVPVDFSENSKIACNVALGLAEKYNAEIYLFHVYFSHAMEVIPVTDTYSTQINLEHIIKEIETKAQNDIKILASEIKDKLKKENITNVKINYSISLGQPDEEILHMSKTYKPGIIVMGLKGKDKTVKNEAGSVTQSLVKDAKVPVLIIPENISYKNIKDFDNINELMYITDFDDSDYLALRKLMNIVSPLDVKIHCIHIGPDSKNPWDIVKIDQLKEYFKKVQSKIKIECNLIEKEDILKGVKDYIEKNKINIVSVTTHKRNIISKIFSPSITDKLLTKLKIPILVFHSK
ncbi:MAG: universal stress protein [Bacteroidales bacterium]|nr:universal stress protein [Bacteroidales bacterium]